MPNLEHFSSIYLFMISCLHLNYYIMNLKCVCLLLLYCMVIPPPSHSFQFLKTPYPRRLSPLETLSHLQLSRGWPDWKTQSLATWNPRHSNQTLLPQFSIPRDSISKKTRDFFNGNDKSGRGFPPPLDTLRHLKLREGRWIRVDQTLNSVFPPSYILIMGDTKSSRVRGFYLARV